MLAQTTQPPLRSQLRPLVPNLRQAPAGWRVLKLGGTTVADADAVQAAAERVQRLASRRDGRKRVAVVVSALAGVTDSLSRLVADAAEAGPADIRRALKELTRRHLAHLDALALSTDAPCDVQRAARLALARSVVTEEIRSLGGLLRAIRCGASSAEGSRCATDMRALALSVGERLSARIVLALLSEAGAELVDPSSLLVTGDATGDALPDARPDLGASQRRARGHLATCAAPIWVVPGFFAHDTKRRLRLLGRGGSDTSATLLGAALDADRVEIWTDVDGVYDADPRRERTARRFDVLSYDEAERLASAGARVLHSRSIAPARAAGVPVVVRDSFHPERPGTWIGPTELRAMPCAA